MLALWLPAGGHAEPGEQPAATVHREAREKLGIEAVFSPATGERPLFVTVAQTVLVAGRRTHISLWYVLSHDMSQVLTPRRGPGGDQTRGLARFREEWCKGVSAQAGTGAGEFGR